MEKQQILSLIASGEMADALDQLLSVAQTQSHSLKDDLLLLSGQYASLNKDRNRGFITRDEYQPIFQQIQHTAISMCNELFEVDKKKRTILFLGASPRDLDVLRTSEESQKIKDGLGSATYRDLFEFEMEPAVQIPTITKSFIKLKPNVVHFSGHGVGVEGISVENAVGEEVVFPTSGLERLFRMGEDYIECVVFNACYASAQAEVISRLGIYVVGMNEAIEDDASIQFAIGFYQGLGEGSSYEEAFDIGMIHVSPYLDSAEVPELWLDGKVIKQ
ncbi:MAG: hypothetical protein HKN68_18905 [Saprospiraceae bacterium]|nr:hypothetical protein [Saprospiraceae bacterium]